MEEPQTAKPGVPRQPPRVWPPQPRYRPPVETVWPPKRRLWNAWQFFLCFAGWFAGSVLLCVLVFAFGGPLRGPLIAIAVTYPCARIVSRRSIEVAIGMALAIALAIVGYIIIGWAMGAHL